MKKNIFRSPIFWLFLVLSSLGSWYGAYKLFPLAFSIVHVDIEMDRTSAITASDALFTQLMAFKQEDIAGYDHTAMFVTDTNAKTFIELEGGGKEVLFNLLETETFQPYTWNVRHFKEYDPHQVVIKFRPNGTLYGFVETLSENSFNNNNINQDAALEIAKIDAQDNWNVSLDNYKLVESSSQTQPGSRVDHTFVFEHPYDLKEGSLRLKLVVSGDRLTEVTHFIKVPESFTRNYANMRSANNMIALIATLLMQLLYVLLGCIAALFIYAKQHDVLWKPAIIFGIGLSGATTLIGLNNLPIAWFSYNSATGMNIFLFQFFIQLLLSFLIQALFFVIIFAAAEVLTRMAFGSQPRLWNAYNLNAASSMQILGRTIGGYTIIGFDLLFVTSFYYITSKYFGWWSPSENLFDPNVLSSYFPWFSSLAQSLQAGAIEECLFRAVPLAGAALLGKKYGKKRWWIFTALILQALIFGAAHANYPAQPAYARLVELFLPSIAWGIVYIYFGLIPTILSHFAYDVVWFALPIFLSDAPSSLVHQIIIAIGVSIPLIIIGISRIKNTKWSELSDAFMNKGWTRPTIEKQKKEQIILQTKKIIEQRNYVITWTLTLFTAIAFLITQPWKHDSAKITMTRSELIAESQKAADINKDEWTSLGYTTENFNTRPECRFIWQELGKQAYHTLLNTYIKPAHWYSRFVKFEGDVTQRAEEYQVQLLNQNIFRIAHTIPQSQPGAKLEEQEAEKIAYQVLQERFNILPTNVTKISAISEQQQNRKDWKFIFSDITHYPFKKGQGRIVVLIHGDMVADAYQYVHVPETWTRNQLEKNSIIHSVSILLWLFFFLLVFAGIGIVWFYGIHSAYTKSFFYMIFACMITLLFGYLNALARIIALFNTAEPYLTQLLRSSIVLILFQGISKPIALITLIFMTTWYKTKSYIRPTIKDFTTGILFGAMIGFIQIVLSKIAPSLQPVWPEYTSLDTYIPYISPFIRYLMSYLSLSIALYYVAILFDYCKNRYNIHQIVVYILCIIFSFILFAITDLYNVELWLATSGVCGILFALAYKLFIQHDLLFIPALCSGYISVLILLQAMYNAWPYSAISHFAAIIGIITISSIWFLHRK